MLDFYLQFSYPDWVGGWRNWIFMFAINSLYGHPIPNSGLTPRRIRVVHLRVLGILIGASLTHNCKAMNVNVPSSK